LREHLARDTGEDQGKRLINVLAPLRKRDLLQENETDHHGRSLFWASEAILAGAFIAPYAS
jgi:hypothetical protein